MLRLFSIYDEVSNTYNNPFVAPTEESAKRELTLALKSPNSNLNNIASDCFLVYVGLFNPDTGEVNGHIDGRPVTSVICSLKTLIAPSRVINDYDDLDKPSSILKKTEKELDNLKQ